MSDKSSIEWTDATWNPLRGTIGRHHCVKISPGCKGCYAEAMNKRFRGPAYVVGADTPRLDNKALLQPLKWKTPRRIFVCSMTDLFMDEHTDEMIDRVFAVMALAPHHTFQVLTKRAKRMREYCNNMFFSRHVDDAKVEIMGGLRDQGRSADDYVGEEGSGYFEHGPFLSNVWLGVSAENQQYADERIPDLLATPAAVRFVSAEPLLGPIDFEAIAERHGAPVACCDRKSCERCSGTGESQSMPLHWIIVGGESGHKARAFEVEWAEDIVEQCARGGVACFVKQMGSNSAREMTGRDGSTFYKPFTKKGSDPSEWPSHIRVREMPR